MPLDTGSTKAPQTKTSGHMNSPNMAPATQSLTSPATGPRTKTTPNLPTSTAQQQCTISASQRGVGSTQQAQSPATRPTTRYLTSRLLLPKAMGNSRISDVQGHGTIRLPRVQGAVIMGTFILMRCGITSTCMGNRSTRRGCRRMRR